MATFLYEGLSEYEREARTVAFRKAFRNPIEVPKEKRGEEDVRQGYLDKYDQEEERLEREIAEELAALDACVELNGKASPGKRAKPQPYYLRLDKGEPVEVAEPLKGANPEEVSRWKKLMGLVSTGRLKRLDGAKPAPDLSALQAELEDLRSKLAAATQAPEPPPAQPEDASGDDAPRRRGRPPKAKAETESEDGAAE